MVDSPHQIQTCVVATAPDIDADNAAAAAAAAAADAADAGPAAAAAAAATPPTPATRRARPPSQDVARESQPRPRRPKRLSDRIASAKAVAGAPAPEEDGPARRSGKRARCLPLRSEDAAAASSASGADARALAPPSLRLPGLFDRLPVHLAEGILDLCCPQSLACFQAAARRASPLADDAARRKLALIPRAAAVAPAAAAGPSCPRETPALLLRFFEAQSLAAAQSTAVAVAPHRVAALLADWGGGGGDGGGGGGAGLDEQQRRRRQAEEAEAAAQEDRRMREWAAEAAAWRGIAGYKGASGSESESGSEDAAGLDYSEDDRYGDGDWPAPDSDDGEGEGDAARGGLGSQGGGAGPCDAGGASRPGAPAAAAKPAADADGHPPTAPPANDGDDNHAPAAAARPGGGGYSLAVAGRPDFGDRLAPVPPAALVPAWTERFVITTDPPAEAAYQARRWRQMLCGRRTLLHLGWQPVGAAAAGIGGGSAGGGGGSAGGGGGGAGSSSGGPAAPPPAAAAAAGAAVPAMEEEVMPSIVTLGDHFGAAVTRRGELYTWGRSEHGQAAVDGTEPAALAAAAAASRHRQLERRAAALLAAARDAGLPTRGGACPPEAAAAAFEARRARAEAEAVAARAADAEAEARALPPVTLVMPPAHALLLRREGTRVVTVAAGARHLLCVSEIGQLWSAGDNRAGQCGRGGAGAGAAPERRLLPVAGLRGARVVAAAAGDRHSVALAVDGSVFTFGDGRFGQLGHAALAQASHVLAGHVAGAAAGFVVTQWPQQPQQPPPSAGLPPPPPPPRPGTPRGCVALILPVARLVESLNPAKLAPGDRVTSVAAGANHTLAVTVGGELLAWGLNASGCLGLGGDLAGGGGPAGAGAGAGAGARAAPLGPVSGAWVPKRAALVLPPGGAGGGGGAVLPGGGTPFGPFAAGAAADAPPLGPRLPPPPPPPPPPSAQRARVLQAAGGREHSLALALVAGRPCVLASGSNRTGQLGCGWAPVAGGAAAGARAGAGAAAGAAARAAEKARPPPPPPRFWRDHFAPVPTLCAGEPSHALARAAAGPPQWRLGGDPDGALALLPPPSSRRAAETAAAAARRALPITAVQAGGGACAAVAEGGGLFVWGENARGSLGLGPPPRYGYPAQQARAGGGGAAGPLPYPNVALPARVAAGGSGGGGGAAGGGAARVVHPDRTLRRGKREPLRVRPIAAAAAAGPADMDAA